jgi:transposase
VIASALRARVTDAKLFENGRHLSACIGLVAENDSTGGKVKQKGLSKKGDRYLRSLLVTARWPLCAKRRNAQASLGRQAVRPHVGQAVGERDRQ